jgi:sugar phosphate isomerase/epimerase
MSLIDRRDFLRTGLAASASLLAVGGGLDLYASPYGLPVGLQLYTVRQQLQADFSGTLHKVASIGYKEVEFAGFDKETVPQIKQLLKADGLMARSGHFGYQQLESGLPRLLEDAHTLGLSYIVLPSLPDTLRHSVDAYKRAADFLTKTGERCKKAGIHLAYHNHNLDFEKFGDVIALDVLLQHTDPAFANFEMDCFWVTRAGYDPVAYMEKYPGRFPLLHIKDERRHYAPTAAGPTPGAAFAPVGRGIIDWKRIFRAARKGGLKHYFVEQDQCELPPFEAIKISYDYLHKLTV